MTPYKITSARLITYSGRAVPIGIEDKVFTMPVRQVKEKILDTFCTMCKHSPDPFVKIEVRTQTLVI